MAVESISECAKATHACGLNASLAGPFVYCCATRKHFYNNAASTLFFVNLHTKANVHSFRSSSVEDKILLYRKACEFVDCVVRDGETQRLYVREWLGATGGL